MSDPVMAASMEAVIRTRFWVSLALSTLVVLISPMGVMLGIRLPFSPAVRSWTLLILTTPIVFWCGWIFIAGAYRSLVSRKLDTSVLIAVGVLAYCDLAPSCGWRGRDGTNNALSLSVEVEKLPCRKPPCGSKR